MLYKGGFGFAYRAFFFLQRSSDDLDSQEYEDCAANRIDNISDDTLIHESGKIHAVLQLHYYSEWLGVCYTSNLILYAKCRTRDFCNVVIFQKKTKVQ